MKIYSDAAMADIRAGTAIVSGAVLIECAPPVLVWGGDGPFTFASLTFQGIGDRGLAQLSSSAIGSAEQNMTLTLSRIESENLKLFDASEVQGAAVTAWRLTFKGDGKTFLDAHIFRRGRVDDAPVQDVIGGGASISIVLESAARGLGRVGGRMRTDADQRRVKADDGFFRNISYAAEKKLYWGGRPPATAGSVLPAPPSGGGGIGSGIGGGFSQREVAR